MQSYQIEPIGWVQSPYTQKFGIPRQPHLVPALNVQIVLHESYTPDCVRGLEGFDYIWIQFIFHDAIAEGWSPLVRPPRLGGKKKMGVWATRSPHRPNHLGLSLLKLEQIEYKEKNIILHCSGGDLLNQTPVIDIKPYLPFVESYPQARAGFVTGAPETLNVAWLPEIVLPETKICQLIEQSIAQDPRPAYQNIPERIYVMNVADYEVRFQIVDKCATILSADKLIA